jgi:hypothetical protein
MVRFERQWMGGVLTCVLVGCGTAPSGAVRDFTPGAAGDPVVQQVQALAASTSDSVTVTLTNGTGEALSSGLLLFSVPFTVGSAPSAALIAYAQESLSTTGNAAALAAALKLSVGTTAFVVPALARGASASLSIAAPATASITYLARVTSSFDDIVSATQALGGSAPGALTTALHGYDLRNQGGAVTLGNGTVGANPGSSTMTLQDASDCPGGALTTSQRLLGETFSAGAGNKAWPVGFGWDGEFGGDWYTDGVSVRVYTPSWGGADPAARLPTVTGFWKTIALCPAAGAHVQYVAKVTTQYTDATSDSTLVLYAFDRAGGLLSVSASSPLHGVTDRSFALYDAVVPVGARQLVVAPMARLGAAEQGDVYFKSVSVDYEPPGAVTTRSLATDAFTSTETSASGTNQPKGWSEFGGDWYALKTQGWATVANPAWTGGRAGVDTGLVKTFALTGLASGDLLVAHVFAAATFTDARSFVRLRVLFNTSAAPLESDRQVTGWGPVDLFRRPIPSGATSATVIINAYLGPSETSSLYVDDFSLGLAHLK